MSRHSGNQTRLLIADDHPVVLAGMVAILNREPDLTVIGQASDGYAAVKQYVALRPDIALLDLRMPRMDGVEAIAVIRQHDPAARVIVLTTFDDEEAIYRGLCAGAKSYLLKDSTPDALIGCIRDVRAGRGALPPRIAGRLTDRLQSETLTPREREVLQLLGRGQSNKQVAARLGVAEATVKVHVTSILAKLGAASRTEAVAVAMRRGLIALS